MTAFMRLVQAIALLAATAFAITGCQREDEGPLTVSGRIFIFNYRIAEATYVLTLARKGELPDNSVVETTFENPAGGPPLVTRTKIASTWEKIALESPAVHCIVRDRPYAVSIRITDEDNQLIQRIETTVTSSLDQTILPEKPLVVGPVYTPNPEVYPGDGTADYSPDRNCPARSTGS